MNWLIERLIKEARRRRFDVDDTVRFYMNPRKGKGRNIVLTPEFGKGKVVDFDSESRKYRVKTDHDGQVIEVHPRNIVPESISPSGTNFVEPPPVPEIVPLAPEGVGTVEPFVR